MSDNIKKIGFVGMGIMGSAMAGNLIKAGFDVTIFNRTAQSARFSSLRRQGVLVAASAKALAMSGPDVICVNVTDTADVEQVLFGSEGIAAGAKPGLIVIDHSTISPTATADFAKRLAEKKIIFLDAPVSGGDVGAKHGTLSIMVGGDHDAFAKCLPMLQAMGKMITHMGACGSGQACKACNQIAVVCNLVGTCEMLAMAKQFGLDLTKVVAVIGAGGGGSWQLSNLGPRIIDGDLSPGFMVDLALKDLAIVEQAAKEKNLSLPGVANAQHYLKTVSQQGGGKLGTQAIIRVVDKAT